MSLHHIIGREASGPHVIIRRTLQPKRRTFLDVVLSAIGGLTLFMLITFLMWSGLT